MLLWRAFFLNSFYKYISGSASFLLLQGRQTSNSNHFYEVLLILLGPCTTSLLVQPLFLEMWGTPQGLTDCAFLVLSRHDKVSCNMLWETGLNVGELKHRFFLSATSFLLKDTCVSCWPSYKMLQDKHHFKLHIFVLKYRILQCFTDCDLSWVQIMSFFHSLFSTLFSRLHPKCLACFLFLRLPFCFSGDQNFTEIHSTEFPLVLETRQNLFLCKKKKNKSNILFPSFKTQKLYFSRHILNLFSLTFHSMG